MKFDDIMPINEAIVHVPKKWINDISSMYEDILIYAYASELAVNHDDKKELLYELKFNPLGRIELIHAIVDNRNKLFIISQDHVLSDDNDETFIDDTTITVVAQYAPHSARIGGFKHNNTHGNMLLLNVASFIAKSKDMGSPLDDVRYMIRSMKDAIEHELVHLIQKTMGNKSQIKKNKGYELSSVGKYKEYFKSPVEFNAMITTVIRDLELNLDTLKDQEKSLLGYDNIMNGIKYSLGVPSSTYTETGNTNIDGKAYQIFTKTFKKSPFMMTLLEEKPKSWKRAVKSIMKHFQDNL